MLKISEETKKYARLVSENLDTIQKAQALFDSPNYQIIQQIERQKEEMRRKSENLSNRPRKKR